MFLAKSRKLLTDSREEEEKEEPAYRAPVLFSSSMTAFTLVRFA